MMALAAKDIEKHLGASRRHFQQSPGAMVAEPQPTVSKAHATYRPDVDGLRAIAVLSVMAFHIYRPLLPGGFLGVDVFFVISGFLITRNILGDINRGGFSLAEFYRRRVKRIAPVMLVVVAVTLIASQILQLPEDARATAKSAVFSLASLANVHFWRSLDTSYFAADSRQVPLLHLWSLGVEEQFYLLWPTFLVLVYRPARSRVAFALSMMVIALLSFALGDLLYDRSPAFVYYMLPSRAGELLLGAITAVAVLGHVERRIAASLIPGLATLGAVVLAVSLVVITERQPFPGWRAAFPTSATALLILVGHCRATIWSRLLALRGLVWVGLVSYSAYLWHWPILALFRYGYGEPGPVVGVSAVVLTLLLAWLSYRYIEQPARRSKASVARVVVRQYVIPASVLTVLALLVINADRIGLPLHSASYIGRLSGIRERARPASDFAWVCQRPRITSVELQDPKCVLGSESTAGPEAILWGDSHAAHYVGMIEAFALKGGFRFRNVEVGSCPPLYSEPTPFVESKHLADCIASLAVVRPAIEKYPVVIFSSAWLFYGKGYLDAAFGTVRRLVGEGKIVVLIGEAPWIPGYDRRCPEKALTYPFLACSRAPVPLTTKVAGVNAELRSFADHTPGVRYFEATSYLCPGGLCASHTASGEPVYFDETHLTQAASVELGREIIAHDGLPRAFDFSSQANTDQSPVALPTAGPQTVPQP